MRRMRVGETGEGGGSGTAPAERNALPRGVRGVELGRGAAGLRPGLTKLMEDVAGLVGEVGASGGGIRPLPLLGDAAVDTAGLLEGEGATGVVRSSFRP